VTGGWRWRRCGAYDYDVEENVIAGFTTLPSEKVEGATGDQGT
jgi:hypothetical protein